LDVEVPDDKKAACGQVSGERITYVGRTETERKALPVSSYSPLRGKNSTEPVRFGGKRGGAGRGFDRISSKQETRKIET